MKPGLPQGPPCLVSPSIPARLILSPLLEAPQPPSHAPAPAATSPLQCRGQGSPGLRGVCSAVPLMGLETAALFFPALGMGTVPGAFGDP